MHRKGHIYIKEAREGLFIIFRRFVEASSISTTILEVSGNFKSIL